MKKQNILLVLKILETESDKAHPMTQIAIADAISAVYPCDRKTVARNIYFLKSVGYPIVKTARGFYLDRKLFSIDERNYIISAVGSATDEQAGNKADLLNRLTVILDKSLTKTNR